MVAICRSRAHPSPPNDVSRTNGRWRMIGSTESVVISSLLGRRSRLVSFFRRRPPPQEPCPEQKLGGESLLAGAGSGEGDSVVKYHNRKWRFHVIVLTTGRATSLLAIREARRLHAIDDFVMAVTAAAAIARQG